MAWAKMKKSKGRREDKFTGDEYKMVNIQRLPKILTVKKYI